MLTSLTWPELMRLIQLHAPDSPGRRLLEKEAARREKRSRPKPHKSRTIRRPSRLNSSL